MSDTVITRYPFILAAFATRKEGLTRKQFQEHNETIYAPLVKKLTGSLHPLAWTRQYHIEDDEGPTGIPKRLIGSPDGLDWDCFGQLTFADELHYQQFIAFIHSDAANAIVEEEEKFCDTSKLTLLVLRREVSIGERTQVVKQD